MAPEAPWEEATIDVSATDEQRQIAGEISSLAARVAAARGPHEMQLILGELRSRVEALALSLPPDRSL